MSRSKKWCIVCEAKTKTHDAMGNMWCAEHENRCTLMDWGKEHSWPLINYKADEGTVDIAKNRFRFYSIGPEYALWFTTCSMGREHMIDTLYSTIFPKEEMEYV